jgi:hypothetical protein
MEMNSLYDLKEFNRFPKIKKKDWRNVQIY